VVGDCFDVEVPDTMIYCRKLHSEILKSHPWPRSFSTQPSGFEYHAEHNLMLPCLTPSETCEKSTALLLNKNGQVLCKSTSNPACVIDHPVMVLA
jgi:hypothetical protein